VTDRSKPNKAYYRNGPDHRLAAEVGFIDIRKRFDFRAISIGKWVTKKEQHSAAAHFYDALCDLMLILNGPETLISLRGSLALQYGKGGRPGVAAHYSPAERSFSLAKNAGPGSIAHEWFHALDHYLAPRVFADAPSHLFASKAWLLEATPVPHPLNDLFLACLKAVILDEVEDGPSELFQASAKMDQSLGQLYYSQPEELCARAFEAFIQDAAITNHFLVKGTKQSPEAKAGLYPQGDQRQRCERAFQDYFGALGRALSREKASL
jgi:hypothetical protein